MNRIPRSAFECFLTPRWKARRAFNIPANKPIAK
jgi:hypothetical protein